MRISAGTLRAQGTAILTAMGVPDSDAATVAAALVAADLAGSESHGIGRLPFYCRRISQGMIDPKPAMTLLADRPAALLLDAANGLGPVAGRMAMELAMSRARGAGACVCAVRHSNHLGALSYYVELAAAAGMIGIAMGNSAPGVAPPGGLRALLGTNPLAAALPTGGDPVVVDMATSQVARGRVIQAGRAGEAIPPGWASGPDGLSTTDPAAALAGSLMPLGGDKGFALVVLVEALTGVLADAGVGPDVTGTFIDSDRASNVGQCFIAIDPEVFGSGFADRMSALGDLIRIAPAASGAEAPRMPGDRRHRERARREREGIDLPDALLDELDSLAAASGALRLRQAGS